MQRACRLTSMVCGPNHDSVLTCPTQGSWLICSCKVTYLNSGGKVGETLKAVVTCDKCRFSKSCPCLLNVCSAVQLPKILSAGV